MILDRARNVKMPYGGSEQQHDDTLLMSIVDKCMLCCAAEESVGFSQQKYQRCRSVARLGWWVQPLDMQSFGFG